MISANGVEYKNVPEQVQYLTEQVADIWTAIEGINPPDLTLYALKTYVDAADSALGTRITAVENSIGTLLTKTEAANTYAKIADIGTYINLSDYVKTVDMYTYVQAEIQNFDLDSNTDFTALKSRVSTLESSVSSMTSDIADANTTAANAQTAAGNAVNTANNASAVATNAYNTATSAASDVADMQTTINNYDSRIDAVESTVAGFQASLTTAQNTANAALAKADSALSMIAGLHSLTKQEAEFEGDSVTVAGFVEGSLCTLTKLEGNTEKSENLMITIQKVNGYGVRNGDTVVLSDYNKSLKLSSGEYYISFNSNITDGSITYGVCYSEDGSTWNTGNFAIAGKSNTSFAFTLDRSCYVSLRLYGSTTGGDVTISNIMLVKGSTAPTSFVPYYTGLKSVSISGLSTGGGVVITTSEGTTSLIPTLDDDTLELGSYDYLDQTISGTSIITSLVRETGIVDLGTFNWTYDNTYSRWYSDQISSLIKRPTDNNTAGNLIAELYDNVALNYLLVTAGMLISVSDGGRISVKNGSNSTKPSGKLAYERATPVTTVLATVTYTDVSVFFETGAAITVNNTNTGYLIESTSTMYGYVAE